MIVINYKIVCVCLNTSFIYVSIYSYVEKEITFFKNPSLEYLKIHYKDKCHRSYLYETKLNSLK